MGAQVHIFDTFPLDKEDADSNSNLSYRTCDVTSWAELRSAFQAVGHVDLVFSNAGVGETTNYFTDTIDGDGNLQEPPSTIMDVNLTGMLYTIKLAWFAMKQQKSGGSIVLTTSATAYVPWQSLAVYTSVKLAVSTLICSLMRRQGSDVFGHASLSELFVLYAPFSSVTISQSMPSHLALRLPSSCLRTCSRLSRQLGRLSALRTLSLEHWCTQLQRLSQGA